MTDAGAPRLIRRHDDEIAEWIARELMIDRFRPTAAVGVVWRGMLIAGIGFIRPQPHLAEAVIAATDRHWATKNVLFGIFAVPFGEWRVRRLTAATAVANAPVRRFLERLGFQFEGVARRALKNGEDAAAYAMLADECPWYPAKSPKCRSP